MNLNELRRSKIASARDAYYESMADHERALYRVTASYGGTPHGMDGAGIADVEFPEISSAASFAEGHSASVELRDPVADLTSPVVLSINVLAWHAEITE